MKKIVLVLYTELCQKEKPLLDRMGALILRLQRLQIKIFTIYLLLDNQPSHVLVAKQHEIFGMLNTITFLRLPSMLQSVPGQPPATLQSTFAAIVKKLIPVEAMLRELLHVVACKQYAPWNTEAVTSLVEQYATEGFF